MNPPPLPVSCSLRHSPGPRLRRDLLLLQPQHATAQEPGRTRGQHLLGPARLLVGPGARQPGIPRQDQQGPPPLHRPVQAHRPPQEGGPAGQRRIPPLRCADPAFPPWPRFHRGTAAAASRWAGSAAAASRRSWPSGRSPSPPRWPTASGRTGEGLPAGAPVLGAPLCCLTLPPLQAQQQRLVLPRRPGGSVPGPRAIGLLCRRAVPRRPHLAPSFSPSLPLSSAPFSPTARPCVL